MTTKRRKDTARTQLFKAYNDLIKQTNLIDVRIQSAKIDNLGCEQLPSSNRISYTIKSWYENKEEKSEIHVFQRYNVSIKDIEVDSKNKVAKLSVTFCVVYSSDIPMSEEFFDIFVETNLPLNTWPYFREFTHNSFARMGLSNVVAPAYKVLPAHRT